MSGFSSMPLLNTADVLLQLMLTFLPVHDRLVVARSCRSFARVANAAHVWPESVELQMTCTSDAVQYCATPFVIARVQQIPFCSPTVTQLHVRTMDHAERLEHTSRVQELHLTRVDAKRLRRGQCPWRESLPLTYFKQHLNPYAGGFLMRFAPLALYIVCTHMTDERVVDVARMIQHAGARLISLTIDKGVKTDVALPCEDQRDEPLSPEQCHELLTFVTGLATDGRLPNLRAFSLRQMTLGTLAGEALVAFIPCAPLQRINLSACHFTRVYHDAGRERLARALASSPHLRTVVAQASVDMPRVLLQALEQQTDGIRNVDVAHVPLPDEFLARFSAVAHRLETLRLSDHHMDEHEFEQVRDAAFPGYARFFDTLVAALDHPRSRLRAITVAYGEQVLPPRARVRELADALQRAYALHGTAAPPAYPDYPAHWDGRLLGCCYDNQVYSLHVEQHWSDDSDTDSSADEKNDEDNESGADNETNMHDS